MAGPGDLLDFGEDSAGGLQSHEVHHVLQSTPRAVEANCESLLGLQFNQLADATEGSSASPTQEIHRTLEETFDTDGTIQGQQEQLEQHNCDDVDTESDKETVGDDQDSDGGELVDDAEILRLHGADGPETDTELGVQGLYISSSVDSLDLLAATNRQILCDRNAAEYYAESGSEDFSDLLPSVSDRLGDSESLSSSLLDSAVGLETDAAVRWRNLLSDNAPAVFGSSTNMCGVCFKKVYPMEMVTSDGVAYHRTCCRCAKCKLQLRVGNFGVLEGLLYCQSHYAETLRLQDGPLDRQCDNAEPLETADPIRGRIKRRTSQADELPPPGISKNILSFFHGLEKQQQQHKPEICRLSLSTDESATPKLISPVSPAAAAAATTSATATTLSTFSAVAITEDVEPSCPPEPQLAPLPQSLQAPDAGTADSDCLPEQGTAKALLNLWRRMEAARGGSAAAFPAAAGTTAEGSAEGGRGGSLVKTLGPAGSEPIGVTRSASSASQPKPAAAQTPPPPPPPPPPPQQLEQQDSQECELPPANNTQSMLRLWRQFDQLGGPAPNPEAAERLRQRQRSFRPRRDLSGVAASAADEGHPGSSPREARGELPPEGMARNLRALFSN